MGRIDVDLYEVKGRMFKATFSGVCGLDPDHEIRRGKKIARVSLRDNPLVTVPGYACEACARDMPRARN